MRRGVSLRVCEVGLYQINVRQMRRTLSLDTHDTHTHSLSTGLQICRLYRKERKLSGTLEVFSNIWAMAPCSDTDHTGTSQLAVWTCFTCLDWNTTVRFLTPSPDPPAEADVGRVVRSSENTLPCF